jgi:NAD+ synthase (glutamine-hydrolysing)
MRLVLACINPLVGDLAGNASLIRDRIRAAANADCILLPELALSGYPPRDLLTHELFLARCEETAHALARDAATIAPNLTIIFGAPLALRDTHHNPTPLATNSLLAFRNGQLLARYDKQLLPTYDVFDEDRYFEPGTQPITLDIAAPHGSTRVGLTICEDLWKGQDAGFSNRYRDVPDPVAALIARGATVILSASASPFVLGKGQKHRDILAGHAKRHNVLVASVNQLGGHDDLLFDGHRYLFAQDGSLAASGRLFTDTPLTIDTNAANLHGKTSTQLATLPAACEHQAPELDLLFLALTTGIRDYLRKTGFKSATLGLSGGIDSALTAALAAHAIGASNVLGVAMPGPYSSDHSVTDAYALAHNLSMPCITFPIAQPFDGFTHATNTAFTAIHTPLLGEKLPDLAEENLQSRIRGAAIMAISNRTGAIVLTTGNKSELAVGYCTLYGDMNGGLAVLSDVTKQLVYALSRHINANFARFGYSCPPIPTGSIDKPPSAELRPNQTDQDSLPAYDVLDRIIELAVEHKRSLATIVRDTGYDQTLVRRILRLIDINEFKRRQAAIGLKVTTVAFGSGRRHPIAQGWQHE